MTTTKIVRTFHGTGVRGKGPYRLEEKAQGLSEDEVSVLLDEIERHLASNVKLTGCTITRAEKAQIIMHDKHNKEEKEVRLGIVVGGVLGTRCMLEGASFLHDFEATLAKGRQDQMGRQGGNRKLSSLVINGEEKFSKRYTCKNDRASGESA